MASNKKPVRRTVSKSVVIPSKLRKKKQFSWRLALPFILTAAAVGGFVVYRSFAATAVFRQTAPQLSGGVLRYSQGGVPRQNIGGKHYYKAETTAIAHGTYRNAKQVCARIVYNTTGNHSVHLQSRNTQTGVRYGGVSKEGYRRAGQTEFVCQNTSAWGFGKSQAPLQFSIWTKEDDANYKTSIGVFSIYGAK